MSSFSSDSDLARFTNRLSFIRLLADRINNDSAANNILFLHGIGGSGKSLLLKYLRANACKRLLREDWSALASRSDQALESTLTNLNAQQHLPVPSALLDFKIRAAWDGRGPKDEFWGLLQLRKDLQDPIYNLRFPRYDLLLRQRNR